MSLTTIQHDPEASVRVGGDLDVGGEAGMVLLEARGWNGNPTLLTPANADQVARALMRFAARARIQRRTK